MYRRIKTNTRVALMTTALVLGLPYAQARGAETGETLRGSYGFTTVQNCARTPFLPPAASGFDPATRRLLVNAEIAEATGSGVMRFARNGTVIVTASGTEVQENQIAAGQTPVVPGTEYTCNGTYSVEPDNRLTVAFPVCLVKSSNPGVTVTVGPLDLEGYLSKTRRAISLSMLGAEVQTVAVAVAGNVVQKRERICTQTMSLDEL